MRKREKSGKKKESKDYVYQAWVEAWDYHQAELHTEGGLLLGSL